MKSRLIVLLTLISLVGIGAITLPVLMKQIYWEHTPLTCLFKWGDGPDLSEDYDYYASYDFLAFAPNYWTYHMDDADSLKIRNAHIMLGMYFNVHTVAQWMSRSVPGSYPRDLWDTLAPHYVRTTEGDTSCLWMDNPIYDFTKPEVRQLAINVVVPYVTDHKIDWLFLDFYSKVLPDLKKFQAKYYQDAQHGEFDFNQNGIGYYQDSDEQKMVLQAEYVWYQELKAAMPGVLLIPNGNLAVLDDTFASFTDGAMLENFPSYFFGSVYPNLYKAINPDYHPNLKDLTSDRYAINPGYVFIEDRYNNDWGVIAAMFGAVDTKRIPDNNQWLPSLPSISFKDPQPVELDTTLRRWSRQFRDGSRDTTLYLFY